MLCRFHQPTAQKPACNTWKYSAWTVPKFSKTNLPGTNKRVGAVSCLCQAKNANNVSNYFSFSWEIIPLEIEQAGRWQRIFIAVPEPQNMSKFCSVWDSLENTFSPFVKVSFPFSGRENSNITGLCLHCQPLYLHRDRDTEFASTFLHIALMWMNHIRSM